MVALIGITIPQFFPLILVSAVLFLIAGCVTPEITSVPDDAPTTEAELMGPFFIATPAVAVGIEATNDVPTANTPMPSITPSPTIGPTQIAIALQLPTPEIKVGDTLSIEGYAGLKFTLLSWQESNHVVDGPYASGYYTFFAQPGMKFINVRYRLTNNGVKEATIPNLKEGTVLVENQGHHYQVWAPLRGYGTEEYTPRISTTDEINLLGGDEAAYEVLLPGQSITARIVFEIPEDAVPVDAQFQTLPISISLSVGGTIVKPIAAPIQVTTTMAQVGDTLSIEGYAGLKFTLLPWQESNHVVDGPYASGYYTFFAQPGMKFINVRYRLTNNGVKEATIPNLKEGTVLVENQGHHYQVWAPLRGYGTEEYTPRISTTDEISLLGGDEGAYEKLLPGQSITGRIVFEIPTNAMPVDAQIENLPTAISFSVGGTLVTAGRSPTPANFKVAFIGDADLGRDAVAVLELIRDEGADMVLHQGDFDHRGSPGLWDLQINAVLGLDFPYFGSIGNHDRDKPKTLKEYQAVLLDRLARITGASCIGEMGVRSACWYKGLFFLLSNGRGQEKNIRAQLASNDSIWRICSWHDNQPLMQTSGKKDEMGWGPYDACREGGAIIATAHVHSYARTHLMDNFETQSIVSESNTLVLGKGKSFVFVSGLGGHSIVGQDDAYAENPWWASVYNSTHGANFGALFCTFNQNGVANRAHCYFKDIDGRIADDFYLESQR